jgi:hypothetical protein
MRRLRFVRFVLGLATIAAIAFVPTTDVLSQKAKKQRPKVDP